VMGGSLEVGKGRTGLTGGGGKHVGTDGEREAIERKIIREESR